MKKPFIKSMYLTLYSFCCMFLLAMMYDGLSIEYKDLLSRYNDLSTRYDHLSAKYSGGPPVIDNYNIPPMTPFYLNASNEAYIINGTMCTRFPGFGKELCSLNVIFAMDPKKNMAFFDFNGGGKSLLTPTNSYFFNGYQYGSTGCGVVYGWSYQDQVESHTSAVSALGSTFDNAKYEGSVLDADSCILCDDYLNVTYVTKRNIITTMEFNAYYPWSFEGATCSYIHTSIVFDYSTLRIGENFDNYFVIPPQCSRATNYCNDYRPYRDTRVHNH
jgi:hypothetical protein